MTSRNVLALIAFLMTTLAAEAMGGWLTAPGIVSGWYQGLARPSWNPPAWVFGPVWTSLYVGMALAAWLVWKKNGGVILSTPLVLFAVQLALNVTWSGLFFTLRSPGLALVEILFLFLAVAATTVAFWKTTAPAGLIFLPYLAWTGFATVLNAAIFLLNRGS